MLHLRTLGGLSIESHRPDAAAGARRRPLALLALLAIAGERGLSREKIAALLWPESDEERARNSLSQAIATLRRDLAAEELFVGAPVLRLNPAIISSDVAEFEQCLASGVLERAIALYQGPFLDGFFIRDAAEFERWVDDQRRRLRHLCAAALERLARAADRRSDHEKAVDWWRRLAALEPTSAQAVCGLMRALVAARDRSGARRQYRIYDELMRQEFGVSADPEVTALAESLFADHGAPAQEFEASAPLKFGQEPIANSKSAFSLRLFGGLSLHRAKDPSPFLASHRKRLGLLAILTDAGDRGVSRETLLAILWPESDSEQARNSLNQTLFILRRELGTNSVIGNGELRLNPEVVAADAALFAQAIAECNWTDAVARYGGPFLSGFYLSGLPEFERWTEDRRAWYAASFHTALEALATEASAAGRSAEAIEWWRRRVSAEPLSSRVARSYASSLADAGDRTAALRHLSTHRALVVAELGAEPDPEVAALEALLKNGSPVESTVGVGASRRGPEQLVDADLVSSKPSSGFARRTWRRTAFASAAVIIVVATTALFISRPLADAPSKPAIAVVAVSLSSNDSIVARWNHVAVGAIEAGLAEMGLGRPVQLPTTPRAIDVGSRGGAMRAGDELRSARAVGARYALLSVIAREGDTIVSSARLVSVADGTLLRIVRPVRGTVDGMKRTIDEFEQRSIGMVATLLDSRAASLTSVAMPGPRYPAYRFFMDGLTEFEASRYHEATTFFDSAYARDTTFTLPLIWSTFAAGNMRLSARRDSLVAWIAEHKDRFDPANRFGIEYFVAEKRRDVAAQLAALQQASAAAPASEWSYMVAIALRRAGRYGESFDAIKLIDPVNGWARGWKSYWGEALGEYSTQERLDEFLPVLRAARAKLPRLNAAAVREVYVLYEMGRDAEFRRALRDYEAVDWQPTDFPPAVLLEQIAELPRSARSRQAIAEECVDLFRQPRATVGLDWQAKSGIRAKCLYYAGRYDEAERSLRELVDSLDRRAAAPGASEAAKVQRAAEWGLLGTVLALNGRFAAAETALTIIQGAPEPAIGQPHNWNLHAAARLAAALGHREQAMDLAMRVRMCCGSANPTKAFLSLFDPALARYQSDSAFLDAFGLTPSTDIRAAKQAESMLLAALP